MLVCYVVLIVLPAARCYGRVWEKLAAAVLRSTCSQRCSGIGAAIGFAIVWTYDTYAG